ncbi:hypothetical protein VKT23_001727 [Stygiomarasmius scandens]|uniref:Uncharacterized protein n=1 Tax=Marasmiellus scandens TaxID=2682957 RepID=A0ABR1K5Z6_9AGAR
MQNKRTLDDDNPLSNAAKRAKTDHVKAGKRKLDNTEELPGGMRIVRVTDPNSRPPSRSQSNPPHSNKKFKADAPRASSSQPRPQPQRPPPQRTQEEESIEQDVRAMDDEADKLRRESRARRLDPALLQTPSAIPNPSRRRSMSVNMDTHQPVPISESPIIAKNKRLREGAMAAIREDQEEDRGRRQSVGPSGSGHRRKSSIGRGKRISSSFELGLIPQPHKHVSENLFYKHIDPDLPEPERLNRLLIWCSYRAAQAFDPSSPSYVPQPDLPPLNAQETETLKKAQENVIRLLAENKIDLTNPSATPPRKSSRAPPPKENEQNASNRGYEAAYTDQIRRMEEENRTWGRVSEFYESYIKKEKEKMAKRREIINKMNNPKPSAKAKGKQKASPDQDADDNDPREEEDWSWIPSDTHLSESSRAFISLSKSVLCIGASSSSSSRQSLSDPSSSKDPLTSRLSNLEFTLSQLHEYVNVGRAATMVAEEMLDERYRVLSDALQAKAGVGPPGFLDSGTEAGGAARLLKNYMPKAVEREGVGSPSPFGSGNGGRSATDSASGVNPSPHSLFRALSRVDSERPPAQIGDAARRAAREVQRMEQEGGVGAGVEGRRLTGVPPLPPTPRRVPGTPRRGNTPKR